MVNLKIRNTILLSLLIGLVGCTMVKPPMEQDENYPEAWPSISSLNNECLELDGTYSNKGIISGGDKAEILLTSILPIGMNQDNVETVYLKVVTKKVDSKGDSFAKLQIILETNV